MQTPFNLQTDTLPMFTNETHLEREFNPLSLEYHYLYDIRNDESMQKEIKDFLANCKLIVRYVSTDTYGMSCIIQDTISKEDFFVDVWENDYGDIQCEFNELSFLSVNTRDMARKAVEEDAEFATQCFDLAEREWYSHQPLPMMIYDAE